MVTVLLVAPVPSTGELNVCRCSFSPRASSTSPSSQSSKMNSMLYQKQFQPSSGSMRMTQHFPGQFNPQVRHWHRSARGRGGGIPHLNDNKPVCVSGQILSQPNIVSPLVRPPHANSFAGGIQRSAMGPPMSPNVGGGLMPHPRPQHPQHSQHPPRGPPGPPLAPRGTQAALKAEQDLKVGWGGCRVSCVDCPVGRDYCDL